MSSISVILGTGATSLTSLSTTGAPYGNSTCTFSGHSPALTAPPVTALCGACCGFDVLYYQLITWSSMSRTPVTVGTEVVIVDPTTNRTSTTTEFVTASVSGYNESDWLRNGTLYSPTLDAPKTATISGNTDGPKLTYPYPYQYFPTALGWAGSFLYTGGSTPTCLSRESKSPRMTLPSPTNVPVIPSPIDPADTNGVWWTPVYATNVPEWFAYSDILDHWASTEVVAAVYESCFAGSPVAPAIAVQTASFLLDTTTRTGSLPKATAADPTPTPSLATPTQRTSAPAQSDTIPENTQAPIPVPSPDEGAVESNDPAQEPPENASPAAEPAAAASTSINVGAIIASVIGVTSQAAGNAPQATPGTNLAQEALPAPTQANNSPGIVTEKGVVQIAGQTLEAGSSAFAVSGTTYSLAPGGNAIVINGVTSQLAGVSPATGVAAPGIETPVRIGSQTVQPGSALTLAGTTYSLATGADSIFINGRSSALASYGSTAPALLNLPGGSTLTADPLGAFEIATQALLPGGSAVIVSGTTYSLAPEGSAIVVNGVTSTLSAAATAPALLRLPDGTTLTADSLGAFQIATQRLVPGGSAILVSGTTYSLATSGSAIVVNGVTSTLSAGHTSTPSGSQGSTETYAGGANSDLRHVAGGAAVLVLSLCTILLL